MTFLKYVLEGTIQNNKTQGNPSGYPPGWVSRAQPNPATHGLKKNF